MYGSLKGIFRQLFLTKGAVDGIKISMEFIEKFLPVNPVIVDCGAHNGHDTLELAKFSGSTVYAFEAAMDIYQQLVRNTTNRPNIHCFNLALNDYNGDADFFVSSGSSDGSSSLLKPKEHIIDHPDVYFEEVAKVKCVTLDSWAKQNRLNRVDMLWLDMQGAEMKMMMASPEILKTVKVIHTEVSTRETYEGVTTYPFFRRFLEDQGFDLKIEAIPEGYDMGNALFVRFKV